MKDVYIIGTGISPWLGYSATNFCDYGTVAVDNALKDAGIEWKNIQAIMAGIFIWGGNAGHLSGLERSSSTNRITASANASRGYSFSSTNRAAIFGWVRAIGTDTAQ